MMINVIQKTVQLQKTLGETQNPNPNHMAVDFPELDFPAVIVSKLQILFPANCRGKLPLLCSSIVHHYLILKAAPSCSIWFNPKLPPPWYTMQFISEENPFLVHSPEWGNVKLNKDGKSSVFQCMVLNISRLTIKIHLMFQNDRGAFILFASSWKGLQVTARSKLSNVNLRKIIIHHHSHGKIHPLVKYTPAAVALTVTLEILSRVFLQCFNLSAIT